MSTTTDRPTHIQVRTPHQRSEVAHLTVKVCAGAGEIPEATAVTIASWWQSPGNIGYVLSWFASGAEVNRTALLDDIHSTRRQEGYYSGTMSDEDKLALDMLSTFIVNY